MLGRLLAKRYRLLRVVGEGGMGTVYEAEHLKLGKHVALKLMHPRVDAGEQARQRFEREARAAAATGHENVIEVFDLGRDTRGSPFLVMELLQGIDLGRAIHRIGRLPRARSVWIVGQVLRALEAVHAVGIHHRDLKPDNVFLTRRAGLSDWVKVLDFGVAEMAHAEGSGGRRKVAAGTLHYMAPEQASGAAHQDARVDVYAAGVLLYECLTGALPFEAASPSALRAAIERAQPTPIRSIAPEADPGLARIVEGAMSKRPEDRPQSARDLYNALLPFGAGQAPHVPQFTPPSGTRRPASPQPGASSLRAAHDGAATRTGAPSGAAGHAPVARVDFAPRPGPMAAEPHAFHASSVIDVAESAPDMPAASALASGARPTHASARSGPARVRGTWVSALARALAESMGPAAYARLIEALPLEAAAIFRGVLLPSAWVDVSVVAELLAAAPAETSPRDLGREAATLALSRPTHPSRHGSSAAEVSLPEWAEPLVKLADNVCPRLVDAPGGRMELRLELTPASTEAVGAALTGLLEALACRTGLEVSPGRRRDGTSAGVLFRPS